METAGCWSRMISSQNAKVDGSADRSSKSKARQWSVTDQPLCWYYGQLPDTGVPLLLILVVVFCCQTRRSLESSTEFNRSLLLSSISGKKNKEHNEMSPVTISRCNEIEIPASLQRGLGHPESSFEAPLRLRQEQPSSGQADCNYAVAQSEGIVITSCTTSSRAEAKMAAMEWSRVQSATKLWRTLKVIPSQNRRMPTIEERDSCLHRPGGVRFGNQHQQSNGLFTVARAP